MLGGLCNGTLVPSALKMVREKTHQQTLRIVFPEQSTDAVIYVTVVVVFYAAIILILVGTNIHRFRRPRDATGRPPSGADRQGAVHQQVMVRLDHKDRTYRAPVPPDIKSEMQDSDMTLV